MLDFIYNGVASGAVAERLLASNCDPGCLRPYIGDDGRSYIDVNKNGKLTPTLMRNATATLRYDDWKTIDDAIVKVAKPRLKLVADLRAKGLTYTIPNGMGSTVLLTETMSDVNDAVVSLDGVRQSPADRPEFESGLLPLPIIHKDFQIPLRQIQASRNGGSPLDTTSAELSGTKVAEEAEKLAIGVSNYNSYTYGGGTIYGLVTFTNRMTRTITAPTASGWTGATFLADVLAMRQQSQNAYHYGPWTLYTSPSWDQYLDDDFKANSDITIRNRVKQVDGIEDVKTLDYLTSYNIVLVQNSANVIREVIGMDITTLQWESHGGLLLNFKVMAILVPQIRADQNSNTGIVHGSTS